MQQPNDALIHSDAFLHRLMRRQLTLSIACAAAFLLVLLGLPLANYLYPEFMARRLFGFTLSWLILGVLMFPLVWIIAWIFIRSSISLENEEVAAAMNSDSANTRDQHSIDKTPSPQSDRVRRQ
jgi:uncharacterized membrane protein (DUF485 family)